MHFYKTLFWRLVVSASLAELAHPLRPSLAWEQGQGSGDTRFPDMLGPIEYHGERISYVALQFDDMLRIHEKDKVAIHFE